MNDAKAEFWGDLQADLYTQTSALYLANQTLESVLATNGRKVHKPILSQPDVGDYVAHNDITFKQKTAEKQTLEVDTFPYAAEVIDITESNQSPYDLVAHSSQAIRKGLINRAEQVFTTQFSSAYHKINGGTALALTPTNILEVIEEADGKLGSFDAPTDTASRSLVVGPRTVAMLRRAKAERETGLGDQTLANGIVGAWKGWTVVSNNNLPFSATLAVPQNVTAGNTVNLMGVEFKCVAALTGSAGLPGEIVGTAHATFRANLISAINGTTGAGTTYGELDPVSRFILTNKRRVRASESSTNVLLTGFGDIVVTATMTHADNKVSAQKQTGIFMVRGAVDLVMQFMEQTVTDKEKGFADLSKGIIGVGAKMFKDGSLLSCSLPLDVSAWKA